LYKFSEAENTDAELLRIKKASIICITFMLAGNLDLSIFKIIFRNMNPSFE